MKAFLIIMILWPSGHRDILTRAHTASMDTCTDSLKEAVRVWMHEYVDDIIEEHPREGDSFVVVAYCAQSIGKSDPA